MPDNGVHEHLETIHSYPYSITPHREAQLSYLGYERQQRQDNPDKVAYWRYRIRREQIHIGVEC